MLKSLKWNVWPKLSYLNDLEICGLRLINLKVNIVVIRVQGLSRLYMANTLLLYTYDAGSCNYLLFISVGIL